MFEKSWVLIKKWDLTKSGLEVLNGGIDMCFADKSLKYFDIFVKNEDGTKESKTKVICEKVRDLTI